MNVQDPVHTDKRVSRLVLAALLLVTCSPPTSGETCVQGENCRLPDCFCPTFLHPTVPTLDIPQIVYFGFDDAVQPLVSGYYDQLFTTDRKNPNGCPITISLYVSDEYTQYSKVHEYYERGMEIGSHSVTHTDIDTADKLRKEAGEEKQNLVTEGMIPASDVVGWRSPNLKTAGDAQPDVLASLNYTYDISLSYSQDLATPWPFTLDFGYPYTCSIPPCPGPNSFHPGFWEVMVRGFMDPATGLPCGYVDGCRPDGEEAAVEYLWYNFLQTYEAQRAPFGLNMHAAWFSFPEYLSATGRFIDRLLSLPDVYIVNVKQMLDWMREPTSLKDIQKFKPWGCSGASSQKTSSSPSASFPSSSSSSSSSSRPQATTLSSSFQEIQFPRFLNRPLTPLVPGTSARDNQANMTSVHSPGNVANSERSNSPGNLLKPQLPSFQQFNPPKTTTINTPSSGVTSSQIENAGVGQLGRDMCIQSVNCHLPACSCRSSLPPPNLSPDAIPQIVYVAIDSHIDAKTFPPLMQIFSGFRKNPNSCPISATIFTPTSGNSPLYVSVLKAKGIRLGVNGGGFSRFSSEASVKQNVISNVASVGAANMTDGFGWRGFASLSPTDAVFQALADRHIRFDSSVMTSSRDMPWPYTLDFGLKDNCSVIASRCPRARYPGLWEVPITQLRFTSPHQTCFFLDTCPGSVISEEAVFRRLHNNFLLHYKGLKSPFGINLRREWLVGPNRIAFQKGIIRFFDEVLRKGDTVVVSIEQMLKWMASPVPYAHQFPC